MAKVKQEESIEKQLYKAAEYKHVDDEFDFKERFLELQKELKEQMEEEQELNQRINENLARIVYE